MLFFIKEHSIDISMLTYIVKYFMGPFSKLGASGCSIGKKKGKVFFKTIVVKNRYITLKCSKKRACFLDCSILYWSYIDLNENSAIF